MIVLDAKHATLYDDNARNDRIHFRQNRELIDDLGAMNENKIEKLSTLRLFFGRKGNTKNLFSFGFITFGLHCCSALRARQHISRKTSKNDDIPVLIKHPLLYCLDFLTTTMIYPTVLQLQTHNFVICLVLACFPTVRSTISEHLFRDTHLCNERVKLICMTRFRCPQW